MTAETWHFCILRPVRNYFWFLKFWIPSVRLFWEHHLRTMSVHPSCSDGDTIIMIRTKVLYCCFYAAWGRAYFTRYPNHYNEVLTLWSIAYTLPSLDINAVAPGSPFLLRVSIKSWLLIVMYSLDTHPLTITLTLITLITVDTKIMIFPELIRV